MRIFYQLVRVVRRTVWAIIVAYMLGLHNVYKQEHKTPDDIVITVEAVKLQEDSGPND